MLPHIPPKIFKSDISEAEPDGYVNRAPMSKPTRSKSTLVDVRLRIQEAHGREDMSDDSILKALSSKAGDKAAQVEEIQDKKVTNKPTNASFSFSNFQSNQTYLQLKTTDPLSYKVLRQSLLAERRVLTRRLSRDSMVP